MTSDIEHIRESIHRYQNLRRFRDPSFQGQIDQLKRWQHQRMEGTYAILLSDPASQGLVRYFLDEIYGGLDLSDVMKSLERTLGLADKLFSDLSLIRMAMEFNAVNSEIDEALASALFDSPRAAEMSDVRYAEASREAGLYEKHLHSIQLVASFASGLDRTVHNSVVYGAFKVGKIPAKMGGLGKLYKTLENGFQVMRALPSAEQAIHRIVDHERYLHERIQTGELPVFVPLG